MKTMSARLAATLTLLFAAGALGQGLKTPPPLRAKADSAALALGDNEFAFDLYARLAAGKNKNVVFSPYSISSAMAMAYAGARGQTARQMAGTLRFGLPPGELPKAFFVMNRALGGRRGKARLIVANALWGQKGLPFLRGFLELMRRYYGAGLRELDFRADAEKARSAINAWVKKETSGKITNLIPVGAVDKSTRLVITDAVYFKASWTSPFEKSRTTLAPFYAATGAPVRAPFMTQTGQFAYAESHVLQIIKFPYAGGLSMVVILPRAPDSLAAMEKNLTAENVLGLIGILTRRRVEVFLPKFRTSSAFGLAPILSSMGMPEAFAPPARDGTGADFSGMDGQRDLWISSVAHKAFIAVDERGTEAAAATAVTMRATAVFSPGPPAVFRADRPFVFLIQDDASGAVLFLGKITNPEL